jgi:hypothetical protein
MLVNKASPNMIIVLLCRAVKPYKILTALGHEWRNTVCTMNSIPSSYALYIFMHYSSNKNVYRQNT